MFTVKQLKKLIQEAFGNAYKFLGVGPDASDEQIKAAFRKLAAENHPDRNKSPEAADKMKKASAAWNLLKDPDSRKKYDALGDRGVDNLMDPAGAASSDRARPRDPFSGSAWDDFVKKAQEQQRAARERSRGPAGNARRPSPRGNAQPPRPASGEPGRRYFVKDDRASGGNSNKFWWIRKIPTSEARQRVEVGWGKVGSAGQTKVHTFNSQGEAGRFFWKMIDSKLDRGYVERGGSPEGNRAREQAKSPPPPPPRGAAPAPKPNPPPAERKPTGKAPGGKTSYKIYGRKGKSPVHTRFGGKVYTPGNNSSFRAGDSANVAVGSDGRLSVNDTTTGRSQTWDASNEAVARMIDRAVIDYLFESCGLSDEDLIA